MKLNNKSLGLTGAIALALSGCATQPGNMVVIKNGTAGEINQQYLQRLGTAVAEDLCAPGSEVLENSYRVETPSGLTAKLDTDGKEVLDEEGEVVMIQGEPTISYNFDQCSDDIIKNTISSQTNKANTVYRLIDYNVKNGTLGQTIPTPSMWNRAGTSQEAKDQLAQTVASQMPSDIVMASLVKMNSYETDRLIANNFYRDMKNDAIAAVIDGVIIGALSSSSGATNSIKEIVEGRVNSGKTIKLGSCALAGGNC